MYFLGSGREIRSTHIVFFKMRFATDHLEYNLSGPKSNFFKVAKLRWLAAYLVTPEL